MNDVHYSSKSNEWETPQSLYDELDGGFGPWGAWRAALAIFGPIAEYYGDWPFCAGSMLRSHGTTPMAVASDGDYALNAVGWAIFHYIKCNGGL